jgi:hypothetical protein
MFDFPLLATKATSWKWYGALGSERQNLGIPVALSCFYTVTVSGRATVGKCYFRSSYDDKQVLEVANVPR